MSKYKLNNTGIVCTYNVTLSRVSANNFAVESSKYFVY